MAPRQQIVLVGYPRRGILACRINNGAEPVHIFGEEIPVQVSIHTVGGQDDQDLALRNGERTIGDNPIAVIGYVKVADG